MINIFLYQPVPYSITEDADTLKRTSTSIYRCKFTTKNSYVYISFHVKIRVLSFFMDKNYISTNLPSFLSAFQILERYSGLKFLKLSISALASCLFEAVS